MGHAAIQFSPPHDREPQRNLAELLRATYDGKRLASFRRVLTALLIATGTPVLVLSRSSEPAIRHLLMILTLVWLALLLPTVRLLCTEWQNQRLTERLQALVYGRR